MRFFRGLTVPAANVDQVLSTIRNQGLSLGNHYSFAYRHPGPLDALFAKPDLSTKDTRPRDQTGDPAVCACGEEIGAAYYAWQHNRSRENDTPIIVEFEADEDTVAIDGRDLLATVFQLGEPELARPALARAFGNAVLIYAERAWGDRQSGYAHRPVRSRASRSRCGQGAPRKHRRSRRTVLHDFQECIHRQASSRAAVHRSRLVAFCPACAA
jgi:hypothetical protein